MKSTEKLEALKGQLKEKMAENWESAASKVEGWKVKGDRIVFTNGCFDILHPGHIDCVVEAASHGDRLVIGLNSDLSVEKLKGEGRPVNQLKSRMLMLAALEWTDLLVAFDQDTPEQLIAAIRPDVLVKGGDYSPDQIAGAKHVLSYGGKVISLGFTEGYSSSDIIEKIRNFTND